MVYPSIPNSLTLENETNDIVEMPFVQLYQSIFVISSVSVKFNEFRRLYHLVQNIRCQFVYFKIIEDFSIY